MDGRGCGWAEWGAKEKAAVMGMREGGRRCSSLASCISTTGSNLLIYSGLRDPSRFAFRDQLFMVVDMGGVKSLPRSAAPLPSPMEHLDSKAAFASL